MNGLGSDRPDKAVFDDLDDVKPEEFADPVPPEDEPYSNSDIDSRKITVTFIRDETGQEMSRADMTLLQLAEHIRFTTAAGKMALPWLKLALFGNKRSEKNSLRTNENVLKITGIEVEHDAGTVSFKEAVAVLAGVRCIVYSSPSYVPGEKERWRALLPLSVNYPPEMREKLVARINGLFAGQLAPESFTLSLSYLYGHLPGAEHRVEVIDGKHLDLRNELYAGSIFKDGSRVGQNGSGAGPDLNGAGPQHRSRKDDDPQDLDRDKIEAALNVISSDCDYLTVWMPIGGALYSALGDSGWPMFDRWSAKAPARYNADECMESWKGFRSLRKYTAGTIFHFADKADPAWLDRYKDEEKLRILERMAAAARASGATSGAGAGPGSTSGASGTGGPGTGSASQGTGQAPPLIKAKPFVLRDPKSIPKRQWVYGRHLIRKFGSATFAPSSSGKTNTFIVEALAMATGRDLLGIMPPRRSRVWLWNGEDPYDELERRVGAACLHYKITPEEIDGWLFINSGRDADSRLVIATQGRHGVTIAVPMVEALIQTIKDDKIDVVMIDPFISSHNVMENDNNAIDAVAKAWTGIADVTNTAIDLGHHTRKTGGAEVTVEDGRGAVALLNAVRPARVLNTMTEDEAAKAGITDGRKRYFRITDGKNNNSLPTDKLEWYRSASVDLGNKEDPKDLLGRGDDMGVVTKWEWPNPLDGVTGADFDKAAAAIRGGKWRKDTQAKDWVGKAVAKALKLDLNNKADKAKVKGLVGIWLTAGSLVEVDGLDDQRKSKTFIEVAEED